VNETHFFIMLGPNAMPMVDRESNLSSVWPNRLTMPHPVDNGARLV